MNSTINSKEQNRINIFLSSASMVNEFEIGSTEYQNAVATARLALYNMSIEASEIALDRYEAEFGKVWQYEV